MSTNAAWTCGYTREKGKTYAGQYKPMHRPSLGLYKLLHQEKKTNKLLFLQVISAARPVLLSLEV